MNQTQEQTLNNELNRQIQQDQFNTQVKLNFRATREYSDLVRDIQSGNSIAGGVR